MGVTLMNFGTDQGSHPYNLVTRFKGGKERIWGRGCLLRRRIEDQQPFSRKFFLLEPILNRRNRVKTIKVSCIRSFSEVFFSSLVQWVLGARPRSPSYATSSPGPSRYSPAGKTLGTLEILPRGTEGWLPYLIPYKVTCVNSVLPIHFPVPCLVI